MTDEENDKFLLGKLILILNMQDSTENILQLSAIASLILKI